MQPDWARELRDQCIAAKVPFFFKQWGNWGLARRSGSEASRATKAELRRMKKRDAGRKLDGRTWDQLPAIQPAGAIAAE
jgi:protein gp37